MIDEGLDRTYIVDIYPKGHPVLPAVERLRIEGGQVFNQGAVIGAWVPGFGNQRGVIYCGEPDSVDHRAGFYVAVQNRFVPAVVKAGTLHCGRKGQEEGT